MAGVLFAALLTPTAAGAQGSTGGSIGKQNKALSGSETVAPPARSAAKPRQAKRSKAREASVERSERSEGHSVLGLWRWNATCQSGQRKYSGTMSFEQSGDGLKASHGGTNFWDGGTITNVRLSGRSLSFDRAFAHFKDHVVLSISGGGMRMSGVLANTAHSGRCQVSYVKS